MRFTDLHLLNFNLDEASDRWQHGQATYTEKNGKNVPISIM